jgi:hypothetical protein
MASSELKDGKTYVTEWARIQEAIIAVADADSDDDGTQYHRARNRFWKTLRDLGYYRRDRKVCRRRISTQLDLLDLVFEEEGR